MQTFLQYASFSSSAKTLDRQRLGKQRVEAMQILNTLRACDGRGWSNHPAVKMWAGFEQALGVYGLIVCLEWRQRGYKDTVYDKIAGLIGPVGLTPCPMPAWLGDERMHRSHRANLVKKLPSHYAPIFGVISWEPYFWPEAMTTKFQREPVEVCSFPLPKV